VTLLLYLVRRSFLLWFGAAFLGIGLFIAVMGFQETRRERRYETRGEAINAVVVRKSIRPASRQGNTSTRYEVTYRFTTEDGRALEGVDAVSVEQWESLDAGSPFRITYLPGAPGSSRAQGSGDLASGLVGIGAGSLFALVGGGLFVWSGRRLRREWRLLRTGEATQGSVVAVEPTNVRVNRVQQWRVRYRYQDHLGRTHEGVSGTVSPYEAGLVEVGGTLPVRFDRQRPEESTWDRIAMPAPGPEAEPTAAPVETRKSPWWRRAGGWLFMPGLIVMAAVLGELPVMKDLHRFTERHQTWLVVVVGGAAFIGFVLFMGSVLYRLFGDAGASGRRSGSSGERFSIREARDAWRRGAWRTSPRWRSNFLVMAGAFLLAFGLFGIFVVVGPPFIKILCGAAILYAGLRTVIASARA
jgi:hypothetical protein